VLATQKILEHVHYNHPTQRANWWGKLIYQYRDGDWFVARGNGRSIFLTGSLEANDSVFFSQAASRYLAFLSNFLLGENDVLIGLVSMTIGFIVVCLLAARFADRNNTTSRLAATFVAFISLIFLGDQIIVAFAFFVSSEYPTWIAMLAITAFLINPTPEQRVWVTTTLAATLAALVHFRPNSAFVSVAVLLLLLVKTLKVRTDAGIRLAVWVVVSFAAVIPLSLIHNLYYGNTFLPFVGNASLAYAVVWSDVFRNGGFVGVLAVAWSQLRELMYWRVPNDPNHIIFFWGCQLLFIITLARRIRWRAMLRPVSLVALLPITYIVPMLKFHYHNYYPRLIVTSSLLCLVSAILLLAKSDKRPLSQ